MSTPLVEQKPLNWTVHEVENNVPDGSRLVTWDISAEDDDGFTFVAEFSDPENAAFASHACNTFYQREAELQSMRERLSRMEEAGKHMRDHLEILSEGWVADGAFKAAKYPSSLVENWDAALSNK